MDKKIIWTVLAMAFLFMLGVKDVSSDHVGTPTCTYDIAPANNAQIENTTLKVVISTTSNQTSSESFVRLQKSDGRTTFFTNQTLRVINGTGETATFQAQYRPALPDDTYRLSAGVFFLNNTFYNYTGTQFNCANRTFTVDTSEGGIAPAVQEQVIIAKEKQKANLSLIAIIAGITALIIYISRKEK